jgi:DNA-directed RNA polymerase delta subunit
MVDNLTNEEMFIKYGNQHWVLRQLLCYAIQEYEEEKGNTVSFVSKFLKEESLVDAELAKKSSFRQNNFEVIDGYWKDVTDFPQCVQEAATVALNDAVEEVEDEDDDMPVPAPPSQERLDRLKGV